MIKWWPSHKSHSGYDSLNRTRWSKTTNPPFLMAGFCLPCFGAFCQLATGSIAQRQLSHLRFKVDVKSVIARLHLEE